MHCICTENVLRCFKRKKRIFVDIFGCMHSLSMRRNNFYLIFYFYLIHTIQIGLLFLIQVITILIIKMSM